MVRVVRSSGLTLAEVLVTLTLFGTILTLTLFFYGLSIKLNKRHDQGSEVYRRANQLMSDIERFVHNGVLVYVDENNLAILPFHSTDIISSQRLLNSSQEAQVLSVSNHAVAIREGNDKKAFATLKSQETLSFAPQEFSEHETMCRYDYVSILFSSTPPSPTREDRTYKFQRQILLDRY